MSGLVRFMTISAFYDDFWVVYVLSEIQILGLKYVILELYKNGSVSS